MLLLLALFLLWRIDSPRVERFRSALVDRVMPSFSWAMLPITKAAAMIEDFQSYTRIYEQNQELRRELQQMKAWREAALQLEQKNARLLDLNQVRLDPPIIVANHFHVNPYGKITFLRFIFRMTWGEIYIGY